MPELDPTVPLEEALELPPCAADDAVPLWLAPAEELALAVDVLVVLRELVAAPFEEEPLLASALVGAVLLVVDMAELSPLELGAGALEVPAEEFPTAPEEEGRAALVADVDVAPLALELERSGIALEDEVVAHSQVSQLVPSAAHRWAPVAPAPGQTQACVDPAAQTASVVGLCGAQPAVTASTASHRKYFSMKPPQEVGAAGECTAKGRTGLPGDASECNRHT